MSSIPKTVIPPKNSLDYVEQGLAPYLDNLEVQLLEMVKTDIPLLTESSQHLIKAGGKRFRPMLVLLFSGLTGDIKPLSITLATAMELCHTATLIHDDIIDEADLRRGLHSVNAQWGNHIAVLCGDFICARASHLIAYQAGAPYTELIADTVASTVRGEIMEIDRGFGFHTQLDDYLEMIKCKTADLISMCCQFGAMVNIRDAAKLLAVSEFGLQLGMAFQMIDDALDYSANLDEMGKPVYQDLREGKMTLPMIHLRDHLVDGEIARLQNILSHPVSDEDISWVQDKMKEHGSIEYTINTARQRMDSGKEYLNEFPEGEFKESLKLLADYVVERKS